MTKKAYYGRNVIDEFSSAISLLIEAYKRCTPTDVLRMVGVEETDVTRQIVLDVAKQCNFTVKSSGRGYVIYVE